MKNNVNRKNINVDKQNIIPLWNFKQEDDAILKLALYKGAIPFDITGQTIVLGAKRPNNTVVEQTDGFTISGNEIDIALKNNILAVNGLVELDLQITDVNGKLTTASFFITVAKKVLGENNLNASNDISAINQLVADLQAKTEEVNNAISTIEPKANQLMNDIQTDYNSLQKIIIDENQAANLQGQITDLGSQLDKNKSQLTQMVNLKMDKNTTNIAVSQINKNLGKFDQTYMTDEFLQQMAGNAPLNQIPADNSLTTQKFVDDAVTFEKRTKNGVKVYWLNQTPLNFNTVNGTLENNGNILGSIKIGTSSLESANYVTFVNTNFPLTLENDFGYIFIDWDSKTLLTSDVTNNNENYICVGWYYKSRNKYYLDTNFTVDGVTQLALKDNTIKWFATSIINNNLKMMLTYPLNFNTQTKKLENPNGENEFGLRFGQTILSSSQIKGLPLQLENLGYIFFDTNDNTFKSNNNDDPESSILIGQYYFDKNVFSMNITFTVDGKFYIPNNKYNIPSNVYGKYGNIFSIMGDSMVAGDNSEGYPWHSYMKELLGFANLDVNGIGGTCITRGESNCFLDRYSTLNTNADLIGVWGGQNDFGHSLPLGTIDSVEETTFYGALKSLCSGLIEKYPGRNIFFITPTPRNYNMFPADDCPKGQRTNKNGNTLIEYVNAIIEVCNGIYNIPVLDLYHNTVYAESTSVCSAILTDGLHFNKKGHKDILAKRISGFVKYTF